MYVLVIWLALVMSGNYVLCDQCVEKDLKNVPVYMQSASEAVKKDLGMK